MSKPLSRNQKSTIVQIAKRGYDRAKALQLTEEAFDAWRARESIDAVQRRISEAVAGDFEPLMAHFLNLAGESKEALRWAMKATQTATSQAMWRLKQELAKAELPITYAETISLSVNKCSLSDASPEGLKRVMMTIRSRSRHCKNNDKLTP